MGRICKLEEELVLEILLRLPAESVIQSKLVCKRWYTLIKDSAFATRHFHYSTTIVPSSTTTLLLTGPGALAKAYVICTLTNQDVGHHGGDVMNYVVEEESKPPHYLFVTSHCNGIFMVSLVPFVGTILWNPTIKEVKLLPSPRYYPVHGEGFGYDSKANEYKVVSIPSYCSCKAEIYTMSSNCWREIEMPIDIGHKTPEHVYCKGVCYWLTLNVQDKITLLWFDMSDEKFGTIELPLSANETEGLYVKINRLVLRNDTIVLLSYPRVFPTASIAIEMWVLNGCCWTKLETIGPLSLSIAMAFWKSDELLFKDGNRELVSYNLRTKKIRNISFGTELTSFAGAYPYVKSLVSLKRGTKLDRLSTFEACLKFFRR